MVGVHACGLALRAALVSSLLVAMLPVLSGSARATACNDLALTDAPASGRSELLVTPPVALADRQVPATALTVRQGGQPLGVASFRRIPARQTDVVIVLDTAAAMPSRAVRAARNAAVSLIASLPERSRVAVVSASGRAEILSGLSSDKEAADRAVRTSPRNPRHALMDGLSLMPDVLTGRSDRSAHVVLIAGGLDDGSQVGLQDVQPALVEHAAALHVLDVGRGSALPSLGEQCPENVVPGQGGQAGRQLASLIASRHRLVVAEAAGDEAINVRLRLDGEDVRALLPAIPKPAAAPSEVLVPATPRGDSQPTTSTASTPWQLFIYAAILGVFLSLSVVFSTRIVGALRWIALASRRALGGIRRAVPSPRPAISRLARMFSSARAGISSVRRVIPAVRRLTVAGGAAATSGLRRARRALPTLRVPSTGAHAARAIRQPPLPSRGAVLTSVPWSDPSATIDVPPRQPTGPAVRPQMPRTREPVGRRDHVERCADAAVLTAEMQRSERTVKTVASDIRREATAARLSLLALVPCAVASRYWLDQGWLAGLAASPVRVMMVVAALILAGLGSWWLVRVTRAPYPALPWRTLELEQRQSRRRNTSAAAQQLTLRLASGARPEEARRQIALGLPEIREVPDVATVHEAATMVDILRRQQVLSLTDEAQRVALVTILPFATCLLPALVMVLLV